MNDPTLLDVLTREGVLISVSIRYWRAAKKLQAEDLGLNPDDVTDRLISLGHKKLLPREALARFALIESRAHALVDANTFPFLNGLGHFLPNRKLEEVTGKLRALEGDFQAAQADFVSQYGRLRTQAVREWNIAAGRLVSDPTEIVAGIEAAFPRPDRMDRYYGFHINLFQITAPERLQTELVALSDQQDIIRARREAAEQARRQIIQGVETFVGDAVASLREQTAGLCDEMLKSFREGKSGVHQKTLNRLLEFIEQFKALNFAGDAELDARLEEVRRVYLTRTAEEYRDDSKARQRLTTGIQQLAEAARELAGRDAHEIVQRFGQMGARRFNLAA